MVADRARDNLRKYGMQLLMKTKLEYDDFANKCDDFKQAIDIKPNDINALKNILEKISIIRLESHGMQSKMFNIRERVRTFFLYLDYKYLLDSPRGKDLVETMLDIKQMYSKWSQIVDRTYTKYDEMKERNEIFSKQTTEKDKEFQVKVDEFHKSFMSRGPHSREVTIDEGLEL